MIDLNLISYLYDALIHKVLDLDPKVVVPPHLSAKAVYSL